MAEIIAVIMGGGKGTRLFPLTMARSKPAVPLGGKFRLIDIPVSNCINSDIKKIYILTQFNSESLNRHILMTYRFDSFTSGFVSLIAAEQSYEYNDWFQGTADAVRKSLRHINTFKPRYVLILSGDQLYHMNFNEVLDYHKKKHADITVCTLPVIPDEAPQFGIMQLNKNSEIVNFMEKPTPENLPELTSFPSSFEKPYLASMGIYLFRYEILEEILMNDDRTDFGKHLIPSSIGNYKTFGYIFQGYWSDIGTIRSFYDENLKFTDLKPDFSLYDSLHPLYTNQRHLPPAKMVGQAHISTSIIGEGAIVNQSEISHSIIGLRSFIDTGTRISDSIVMGADYYPKKLIQQSSSLIPDHYPGIGKNCIISNSIIDKNVQIGDGTVITNRNNLDHFDGPLYYIRDGLVVIPKDTIIPAGTII
ncbi:MAG: glucose-1-phosphate adenylyltransferase [Candidatus Delongbacteria bacterium]|nr:glucose-1-phosphate adenylyltransferase [Candidatus Delongbacteria bacterium]